MSRTDPSKRARGHQMTSRDALNFYLESEHTSGILIHAFVVNAAQSADSIRTVDDALDYARTIVDLDPIFHRRLRRFPLDLDHPYWVDEPNVKLEDHVFLARQDPGDIGLVRRRLVELSRDYFDFDARPAWQLHFLVGLNGVDGIPAGGTLMIVKFHHSAIDGVGTSRLVSRMLSPSADDQWVGDSSRSTSEPVPSTLAAAARLPVRVVTLGRAFLAKRRITRARESDPTAQKSRRHAGAPATRFNRGVAPDMVFDLAWFDLDRIRAFKSGYDGVTVNDVVLTAISLAMSTYLDELGELPDRSLTMSMPMSTRSLANSDTANQLSIINFSMYTDIPDPIERLLAIHESAVKAKLRVAATANDPKSALNSLPAVFLPVLAKMSVKPPENPTSVAVNTMISNVAYDGPLELRGAPVVGCLGVLPTVRGVHLAHSLRSIGSSISVSVTSNRGAMADVEHYTDLLRLAFEEVLAQPARAETGKKL